MARLGAIDIGSNAIRMKVVDVEPPSFGKDGPRFHPFREVLAERAAVRLGHDVFTKGRIEQGMMTAACDALGRFRAAMEDAKVDRYRAVATSAAREAKNGDLLVERAEREAGVAVDVIEGVEEARLVQLAVRERMGTMARRAVLIDIGGGSTELTLLIDGKSAYASSLPIGTVRLIDAFLKGDRRVDSTRRQLLREYVERAAVGPVRDLLEAAGGEADRIDLVVGTGGNVETLADLCPYPSAFPVGRAVEVASMSKLLDELYDLNVQERSARYGLRADRADTIVPAAKVLCVLAEALGADRLAAPGVGLKEGVLVDLAQEHFVPHDFSGELAAVTDACVRLGRRYHFDEAHGRLVARFATQLFDDLEARHGLGPRDRILLHAAAMLHDVGDFVRYEGHHKHSYYIVSHSDLMGLTAAERQVVANVARYHRKSHPSVDHENFRALPREARAKVKAMAAILRVADALDREHRGKVSSVRGELAADQLKLVVTGADDIELEAWTVRAKSGLLRDALGVELRFDEAFGRGSAPPPSVR